MAVEIGNLVVSGSFGSGPGPGTDSGEIAELKAEINKLRHEMAEFVEEMLFEAERRRRER